MVRTVHSSISIGQRQQVAEAPYESIAVQVALQQWIPGAAETIAVARCGAVRGGEVMAEPLLDSPDGEDGQVFELPDGFAVKALGPANSWNGFPVPVLGLVDALRVCLHVSEDADLYFCSPLPDGRFAADGLQWQQRGTRSA